MGDAIGKEGDGLISEGVLALISPSSVLRSPNLSACHRCGLGFPINGSVDRFETLNSLWRIVLLCRDCFAGVGSGQVCSYCFSWLPELEKGLLDCNLCSRRVHRACVSQHHRNFSHSLLDAAKFACVDCCPIPQLRQEVLKKSGTTQISEKKATSKGKARENVAKKVMVASGSGLKRKACDDVQLAREPSCINVTVPDEKAALRLHQAINGSKRISRSLCPRVTNQFTVLRKEQLSYNSVVRIIESNSCTNHCEIEVGTENKSLLEGRGKSQSISTCIPLFKQENGDLRKQVSGCNTSYLKDFSSDETEGSLKFRDCTDNGSNDGLALLPSHSLNTRLMSASTLTEYRFSDCDGEGSSKLQRKSIDVMGQNGFLKKYFRKSWGSGRIMLGNSHSISSNGPLFERENGDLTKRKMACSTVSPMDFSLQEKETSLKLPDSIDDGCNPNSTLLPCHSLNSCLKSTLPVTKDSFAFCDGAGYSKLQRKSVDEICPRGPMKKYFRKHWDHGRIMQGNSHPILTNSPLFKRNNRVLMKQTWGCNAGCARDFFLKEIEASLKFPDSTDDASNSPPTLLSCHNSNTWSNSLMALMKYRFGDGSSKLQRKSIDSIACTSMKKYFRKHWSSERILNGNSNSILVNSPLFKKENEALMKQTRGNIDDDSNTGSALLPCHSLNTWRNCTIPLTNYSFCNGDGGRSKELHRKPINTIVPDNIKKYYRKRWGSKRVVQGNSQSISANNPLLKWENGDLMKQTRGYNFPDSTDNGSNIDSALLQFNGLDTCLNGRMLLRNYRFGDGDREGCSKLQRRSINAVGSDGSLKKYCRKHLGS